jgi:hypothetical protein
MILVIAGLFIYQGLSNLDHAAVKARRIRASSCPTRLGKYSRERRRNLAARQASLWHPMQQIA